MVNLEPKGREDEHEFGYTQILDNLFLGSDLCKGGVCLLHAEQFKALAVTVELNLSHEENELPPSDIEVYAWLPTVDGYAPSPLVFDIGTSLIHEAITNGKKVYVHCKNGHGRSPSIVAAYLIRFEKYNVDDAIRVVEQKRPESHIEDVQIEALKKFAEKWSK